MSRPDWLKYRHNRYYQCVGHIQAIVKSYRQHAYLRKTMKYSWSEFMQTQHFHLRFYAGFMIKPYIKIITWKKNLGFLQNLMELFIFLKVSKKETIRNRYNQLSHLARDTTLESDKTTRQLNNQARQALSQQVTKRPQRKDKKVWQTQTINNKKLSTMEALPWTVNKNIFTGEL